MQLITTKQAKIYELNLVISGKNARDQIIIYTYTMMYRINDVIYATYHNSNIHTTIDMHIR